MHYLPYNAVTIFKLIRSFSPKSWLHTKETYIQQLCFYILCYLVHGFPQIRHFPKNKSGDVIWNPKLDFPGSV